MGDVEIGFSQDRGVDRENAILLLAAAESLGRPRADVRTGLGKFVVDEEIAVEAGLVEGKKADPESEKPAKKAPAKKAAKKAAKKSTAKKSASKNPQE